MQLFSRNKALAALSLGALAALGACGDDVTVPPAVNPPVTVTISPSNANVNVGAFVDLAVAISGGTTTPTLTSCSTSSAAVATAAVQGGNACRVTGVSVGAVSVTATTSAGQTAAASVTVNAPAAAISGIAISPAAQNLQVGGSFTITANPTTTAPGATVSRAFVSSNPAVASVNATTGAVSAVAPGQATITVTLTGSGTGLTTANVSGQVAVTVTANPPAITSITTTPQSALMVVGGSTVAGTSTVSAATGITPTYTAGSSNPGVATATVTSAGAFTITAVGPGQATITITAQSSGNANFSAASATASIPVTVNAPAQVSIANITQGGNNNPVNISNINGQIQVQLNLLTNNNVVRSVRLFVCPVGGSCPTAPAAEQTFGTAGAASGDINMFINTADFTVASDWSDATVRYTNGQKNLVAQIETQAATQANNNLAILNFNNDDAFAARHIAPGRSAINTGTNLTWFGGPDAAGRGSVTVVPVIYTAGRSVQRANVNITGAACSNTAYTFVTGTDARPWTLEYGRYTTAPAATTTQRQCTGTSTGLDLGVAVSGVIDNAQNSITVNTFATNTSNVPAVTAPAIIRGDYQGPSFTITSPATRWASITNSYSFRTNTSAPTDAGVGPRAVSTFTYAASGCGLTSVAFDGTTGSGVMQECSTNFTENVYTVTGTGADLLDNPSTVTANQTIGIDNTAPVIRYTNGTNWVSGTATPGQGPGSFSDTATFTVLANTIFTGASFIAQPAGTDTIFGADALDERSGLNTAGHYLVRANQAAFGAAGTCVVGSGNPGAATFITAPGCGFGTATIGGTAMADGYRPIARVLGADITTEGYYTYQARITDRAGNSATTGIRRILHSATRPALTGMGIPSTVTAAGPNTFTPNFTELVEAHFTNFSIGYGTGSSLLDPTGATRANLLFPALLYNARFNDAIGANGNVTVGTPFTAGVNVYTNIEYTSIAGALDNAAVSRPDSSYSRIVNAAGLLSTGNAGVAGFFGVQLLDANVATDAANWSGVNTNLQSFTLGTNASAWNAPAGGVKAIVTAASNQLNSPFTRLDFYEYQTATPTVIGAAAGQWVFIGSIDATTAPCTSPASACPVYIADNGATRVWTYRITAIQNGVNGLAAGTAIATPAAGRRFMAVATSGTKGRALATNPAAVVSSLPGQ
jgi:trimeric autotransporter adhesin